MRREIDRERERERDRETEREREQGKGRKTGNDGESTFFSLHLSSFASSQTHIHTGTCLRLFTNGDI
jgi:hypothetical protein